LAYNQDLFSSIGLREEKVPAGRKIQLTEAIISDRQGENSSGIMLLLLSLFVLHP